MEMKLLIAIASLLIQTSCSSEDPFQKEEKPTPPTTEQPDETDPPKSNAMKITIGSTVLIATLATNTSAAAFKAMLPLTLSMSDFNSNEKVAGLPGSVTTAATNPGIIHTGDIMLYGSNALVLFYETFETSYFYTKIGRIDNTTGLKAVLGKRNVTVKFEYNDNGN